MYIHDTMLILPCKILIKKGISFIGLGGGKVSCHFPENFTLR